MSDEFVIREPTEKEIKEFYSGVYYPGIRDAMAMFIDNNMVGMVGFIVDPVYDRTLFEDSGDIIGFMDIDDVPKIAAVTALRLIRHKLASFGRDVIVQCDEHRYPGAHKVLRTLGLVETDQYLEDGRNPLIKLKVWKWLA